MTGVSVVIPTFRRPEAVGRAVASVLAQTAPPLEVIVIVDGRDAATEDRLCAFGDAVRVIVPDRNLGNAAARNRGIAEARGDLVAFLDDDDRWRPQKLAIQLSALRASRVAHPVISCRLEAQSETSSFVWPRRVPQKGEPIGDYLFTRRTPATGEGLAQTSTLLAPKRLFDDVPFAEGLRRYVDLDWLLRAGAHGAELVFPQDPAPLSGWSIDERRDRITNSARWQWDKAWAEERSHLLTGRARAAFLLTLASLTAARAQDRGAYLPLLRAALDAGRPSLAELAFHTGNLALPFFVKDGLATLPGRRGAAKGGAL